MSYESTREITEFFTTITNNLKEYGLINTIAIEFIRSKSGNLQAFYNGFKIDGLACGGCRDNKLLQLVSKGLGGEYLEVLNTDKLLLEIENKLTLVNRKDQGNIKVSLNDLKNGSVLFIYSVNRD